MEFTCIEFYKCESDDPSKHLLGITTVSDNIIISNNLYEIQLPITCNSFLKFNSTSRINRKSNYFPDVWYEIKANLNNRLIVSFNSDFNMQILKYLLNYYNLDNPSSLVASIDLIINNYLKREVNLSIKDLIEMLNVDIHTDEYSLMTSNILLSVLNRLSISSFSEFTFKCGLIFGEFNEMDYYSPKSLILKEKKFVKLNFILASKEDMKENLSLNNKVIVFTGALSSMKRGIAASYVAKLNGYVSSSVNSKTNIVVASGKYKISKSPMYKSRKLKIAEKLIADGQNIEIIDEESFLKLIGY